MATVIHCVQAKGIYRVFLQKTYELCNNGNAQEEGTKLCTGIGSTSWIGSMNQLALLQGLLNHSFVQPTSSEKVTWLGGTRLDEVCGVLLLQHRSTMYVTFYFVSYIGVGFVQHLCYSALQHKSCFCSAYVFLRTLLRYRGCVHQTRPADIAVDGPVYERGVLILK